MKRNLGWLTGMLSIMAIASFAQPAFGIKGGINRNTLALKHDLKTKKVYPGVHLGLFATLPLSKNLAVIPEIQFATRRYSLNSLGDEPLFGFIEVPVMLSWRASKVISLEAGPYGAIKLYASTTSDLNTIVDAYSEPLEAGLAAGLRFHITENLSVIPRYYHGITPVADSELRDETNQFLFFFEAYNRTMQLSVAWKIK